jgi:hypothetical protein
MKCGSLDVSQPYGPAWPVTRTALPLLPLLFYWEQFVSSGDASRSFDIRELFLLPSSPAFVVFHKHCVALCTGSSIHKKKQLYKSVCNTREDEENANLWCHTPVLSVRCFPKLLDEALDSWPWVLLKVVWLCQDWGTFRCGRWGNRSRKRHATVE